MSHTARTLVLLAFAVAAPAYAQNLENGTGSGPSQQLSVPPNERGDPDFSYGTASDPRRARTTRPANTRRAETPDGRTAQRTAPPPAR